MLSPVCSVPCSPGGGKPGILPREEALLPRTHSSTFRGRSQAGSSCHSYGGRHIPRRFLPAGAFAKEPEAVEWLESSRPGHERRNRSFPSAAADFSRGSVGPGRYRHRVHFDLLLSILENRRAGMKTDSDSERLAADLDRSTFQARLDFDGARHPIGRPAPGQQIAFHSQRW